MPKGKTIDKKRKFEIGMEADKLKEEGIFIDEIANRFNLNKSTINRFIRDYKKEIQEIQLGKLGEKAVSAFNEEFGKEPEVQSHQTPSSELQEISVLVFFEDTKPGEFLKTTVKVKNPIIFEEFQKSIDDQVQENIRWALVSKGGL